MALKYYKNINVGEVTNSLKIYDDSYSGSALEIGGIRDIRLELMGGQNEVDSPIVKTGLSFTLLDAPDEESEGKYYGGWEEFYTASPTRYKVVLETNGVARWSGYVTPHSFEEDLVYRGSITITARDNIGRLKDYVWDEEGDDNGMVSVSTILAKAWEKAQIAMPLLIDPNADFPKCNGKAVYESMLVADAFTDKTWGDVVESVLVSCGLALRYGDNNTILLTTLRGLSNVSKSRASRFVSGAHRSIEPSVKGVVIEQGYEVAQGVEQKEANKKRYLEDESYTYRYWNVFGEEKEAQGVVNPLTASSEVGAWQNATESTSLFFNVYGRERRESMQKRLPESGVMYFAANVVGDRYSYVDKKVADDLVWKMRFGVPVQFYRDFVNLEASTGLGLRKVKLQIVSNPTNASRQYYNGNSWQSTECYIEEEYNVSDDINEVSIPVSVDTEMTIRFAVIYLEYRARVQDGMAVAIMNDRGGYYASLLSMTFDVPENNNSIVSGRRIELEGNTEGNRLLEESIELGAMKAQQLMPQIVVNGMYMPETYRPADAWSFVGQTATYPLMLLIAMQKAAIYGRPCDMITGEVIVDGGVRFDSLITYNGKKYLVLGGTWNVINGRIEGVCLREVVRYEDYWIEGKEVRYSVSIPASSSGGKGGYVGGSGGSGSASGGVRELSALTDVELSAVADDDVLSYVSGKWKNVSKVDYLADLNARIAKFEDWFVLENGYIKATRGFFSDGTMGARAVGSTGGGGGGLISYVYGYDAIEGVYYDTDKNNTFNAYTIARLHSRLKGVEDAGYITSSALNGYAKTTDLANYATTSALTSGLANKQDTITSSNKLPYSYLSGVPDLSLYALNSTLASVAFNGSYADLNGTPQSLKNPYALTFGSKTYDGSSAKTITASDLGALTSHQAIYGLTIKRNGTLLGVYTPNSASKEIDIAVPTHLSDFTDDVVSGKYLKLSGGTLSGSLTLSGGALWIISGGKEYAYNVNTNSGEPIFLQNDNWRVLLHSGNIAAQLDSRYFRANYGALPTDKDLATLPVGSYWVYENTGLSNKAPITYSSLVVLGKSYYAPQLSVIHNASRAWLRGIYNGESSSTASEWHELAFLDSNVASATKLATPRTIWGQSFDGTGNVDGYMYMSGLDVLHLDDSNLWLNFGAADVGKSLRLCGNDVAIYYGKSSNLARAMTINSSGNVGIGTDNPQNKLDVNGNAHFTGLITVDSGIKIGDATITWDASANALKIDKSVYSLGGFGTK